MRVLGESVNARYLEQLGRAAPPPADALADAEPPGPTAIDGLPVVFPQRRLPGRLHRARSRADAARASTATALVDEPGDGVFREAAAGARSSREIRRDARRARHPLRRLLQRDDALRDGQARARRSPTCARRDLVYDADGAVWLRATALGLERDRVLVKRRGEPTYLLPDIAYHREKFRARLRPRDRRAGRRPHRAVPVRARRRSAALGCDAEPHRAGDAPVRDADARRRAGEAVHAPRDLRDRRRAARRGRRRRVPLLHGRSARPTAISTSTSISPRSTDWKKNPAYYVQYAHARTHGIERKARGAGRRDARRRASVDASRARAARGDRAAEEAARVPGRGGARRARRASRTTSPTTCASSRACGIPTCRTACDTACCRRTRALTQRAPRARARGARPCSRTASPCSASPRRSRCDERTRKTRAPRRRAGAARAVAARRGAAGGRGLRARDRRRAGREEPGSCSTT